MKTKKKRIRKKKTYRKKNKLDIYKRLILHYIKTNS